MLVCGFAAGLHDDLRKARTLYPDAPCIAVNGASGQVKAIALVSAHPERLLSFGWIRKQKQFGTGFSVHGATYRKGCPWVQYWWADASGGGGSAWAARKVAWLMGFDPVILCGCPLEPGPYVGNHGIGGFMLKDNVVEDMRKQIEADTDWHQGVRSLSGWTRDFFGC